LSPLHGTMTKRNDIQGIRGLAIAAVLAFHLDEATFPSGYIGVDIFFVLSGYLMSVILSKEPNLNLKMFGDFYTRRFKRIVPLYAILLVALTIAVPCFLLRNEVLKFCDNVVWAAAFATNVHTVSEEEDYFAELSSLNVLTHTWSLGVEIQYYLIVPFIILTQRKLSDKYPKFPFIAILLKASLVFQHFSSPQIAFNMLPSRVWQFLAGGLSHDITHSMSNIFDASAVKYEKLRTDENDIESDQKGDTGEKEQSKWFHRALGKRTTDFISIALCVLIFSPWDIFPAFVLRPIAVALTSGLLILGCEDIRQSRLLTNRPLVYLGDLSYVVYLAHWPIIIVWKSVSDSSTVSLYGIYSCLALTFIVSICIHHTIEQYFISAKTKTASIVVALLYGFIAVALILHVPVTINKGLETKVADADITAAIEWNEKVSHNGYRKSKPFKECLNDSEGVRMRGGYTGKDRFECGWKPVNATGSLEILLVGNSVAHLAAMILQPVIEENFPEVRLMRLFAMPACHPNEFVQSVCPAYLKAIPKQVEAMKPDITFVMFDDSTKLIAPLKNPKNDAATAKFAAFLQPIANSSRVIILDEFYPRPTSEKGMGITMYKRLLKNEPITDLKATYQSFRIKFANYFARLDLLRIPNLIRHNTSAAMCAEELGWCWWYNRKNLHTYFTDHTHLTVDGRELLRESYTNVIRNAIDRLEL
ncbi:hypothetical protein PRIPAC_79233, partial [Pristionchus pacificus]